MGFKAFCAIFEVIRGSRWRKASKCKKLMERLKQSLAIQKNRRNAMMRQSRADIAQLLQNGLHKAALTRVMELHKDELKLSAYDQVDKFCDCVVTNLKDISRDRKLSVDVCEAIASLIFAAARCGELPELYTLRNLFRGLLGQKFDRVNAELLPENTVNSQIKNCLSVQSASEDVKIQLINDVAREYKLHTRQKVDAGTKKFEEMLPDIGKQFALQDCKDMVAFWSNKTDSVDVRRDASIAIDTSENEEVIGDRFLHRDRDVKAECHIKDAEEIPRSPHVHPKLPEYDDLVVQFGKLNKNYMQKSSTNNWLGWKN